MSSDDLIPKGNVAQHVSCTTSPRVVLEGTTREVRIAPVGDLDFTDGARYEVVHLPMEDLGASSSFREVDRRTGTCVDGHLVIETTFEGEQEHSFVVERINGDERSIVGDVRIYSVARDLIGLRPFKGDMHMHSNRSDGRDDPAYVAASCRKIGLDFMALTDHHKYAPSIEAQEAFENIDIDLRIFRGEEVHPPENPMHIINFGGRESVNDMFANPSYRDEVSKIEEELLRSNDLPAGVDPYYYASALWCFKRIRDVGGMSIFCHPYWISRRRYHIPVSLTTKIFDDQPYDAFELIGGYHLNEVESNMLQVLRYQDECSRGKRIPVVGVSDAHGCDRGSLFGWYYTIVFSPSSDFADLVSSIRDLRSVAVEHLPGNPVRIHGPFRMAKYAHFVFRELLETHDTYCREEGELMVAYYNGDGSAAEKLARYRGRASASVDLLFAE